jgi:hypothetical protein
MCPEPFWRVLIESIHTPKKTRKTRHFCEYKLARADNDKDGVDLSPESLPKNGFV